MTRMAWVAVAAGVVLAVGGCGADEGAGPVGGSLTHISGTASGVATVPLGRTLVVDLGAQNSSIGDGWYLVTPPDPAVLVDRGAQHESDCDAPGCGSDLSWHIGTAGAGTTSLTLQYCYRSRPPDCEPMPDRGPAEPVTLDVTVVATGS